MTGTTAKMRTIPLVWKIPYLGASSLAVLIAVFLCTLPVRAQTDEIQVYDAEIADPGIFNLMIHTNFTPSGRRTPAFSDAIVADQSVNGAAEWAYGVTPWFEQGLYLPVYSLYSSNQGATINGFKIRELFVSPHAKNRRLFYGVNFEFSVNAGYWESKRITSEIRPIVGVHLQRWDLIYNPILDTDYTGGLKGLEYNPAGRVAYNLTEKWAVAIEQYDGFGPLRGFVPHNEQFHESWAVMDRNGGPVNIEAGVGVGWSGGADRVTLKLMLSRDLNSRAH
ncbi:MAG TPA: hypothetical protein VKB60_08930 [Terriglobales bacterium]|nr:hypothetical protein [Terriglobales bacterium]